MAKNLVIVESPAKVKTIRKFLGSRYDVEASMGHVRDLPKSQLGIDVEHDFEPKYITIRGKGDLLARLRREAKNADHVFLATDPDREGEAISWHLVTALNLDPKKMRRITFNEITKNAVRTSLKNPRDIDMNLVNAQQARRVLDRLVGYEISPVLWKKVKRGLSAGRVQSVALRIIARREKEIADFIPSEYWTLDALLQVPGQKKPLEAKFFGTDRKMTVSSKEEMDRIVRELEQAGDVEIRDLAIYETKYRTSGIIDVRDEVLRGEIDFAVFTSASTVRGFCAMMKGAENDPAVPDLSGVRAVCIGRQTKAAADAAGMRTWMARRATIDDLVDAVVRACAPDNPF